MKGQENTGCWRAGREGPKSYRVKLWETAGPSPTSHRYDMRQQVLPSLQHLEHFVPWPPSATELHPIHTTTVHPASHPSPSLSFFYSLAKKIISSSPYFIPTQPFHKLLPVHTDNPQVTFTQSYVILAQLLYSSLCPPKCISIVVDSPGQECRALFCLWSWMVFGANGASAIGRRFQCLCNKKKQEKKKGTDLDVHWQNYLP